MLVQPIKVTTLFLFLMLVQSIKAVTTCLPQILSHCNVASNTHYHVPESNLKHRGDKY